MVGRITHRPTIDDEGGSVAGQLDDRAIQRMREQVLATGKRLRRADSANLLMQVTPMPAGTAPATSTAASWIFRYQLVGRRREMGLGSYPTVSASKARAERDALRKLLRNSEDPLDEGDARREALALARAEEEKRRKTFKACVDEFLKVKENEWRNAKHRQQWKNTLETYGEPLNDLAVASITVADIERVMLPIWMTKTETAKRVLGRIEKVLDYAKTKGWREGENPAAWRGNLSTLLPAPGKIQTVQHHRALPWSEAPALMAYAKRIDTPAARALVLTLLCATRSGETLNATWDEVNLEEGHWTIPAARMKAGKPHRIPLSREALALLQRQKAEARDRWVFPGQKRGQPLSNMAMAMLLKRRGADWGDKTTVHGLRSTFRVWVAERTQFSDRLAEIALAHQLRDRVEGAYNRTDQFEHRRELMQAWADHLEGMTAKVIQLPKTARQA